MHEATNTFDKSTKGFLNATEQTSRLMCGQLEATRWLYLKRANGDKCMTSTYCFGKQPLQMEMGFLAKLTLKHTPSKEEQPLTKLVKV
jgi:hypothetical protein